MKIVSVFQTADGKQFSDKDEARKYETELEAMTALRSLLSASIESQMARSGNIDNVLRQLLMETSEVRRILTTYGKKMPKVAEAA